MGRMRANTYLRFFLTGWERRSYHTPYPLPRENFFPLPLRRRKRGARARGEVSGSVRDRTMIYSIKWFESGRGATVVRLLIGGLLVAAVGLKLFGTSISAVPHVGVLTSVNAKMIVLGWELLLGVWLLCGTARVGSWMAACLTFLSFAAVSGYLGVIGKLAAVASGHISRPSRGTHSRSMSACCWLWPFIHPPSAPGW